MADFWTIHVFTAAEGRDGELRDAWELMARQRLEHLGLSGAASLFAVEGDARVHYTPMRWATRAAYDQWRGGAGRQAMDALEGACSRVEVIPLETAREVRR